jgi:hypothetical protein
MNRMSVEERKNATSRTDLLVVFDYQSRVITPDPSMIAAFRANLPDHPLARTDDQIDQIIAELIHTDGVTEPNAFHELRLIDGDMVAFRQLLNLTGLWKSLSWRSADVPRTPANDSSMTTQISHQLPPNGGHKIRLQRTPQMITSIQDLNHSCVRIKMSRDSSPEERAMVIRNAELRNTKVSVRGRVITIRSFPRDEPGIPAWAIREASKDAIEFAPEPKA